MFKNIFKLDPDQHFKEQLDPVPQKKNAGSLSLIIRIFVIVVEEKRRPSQEMKIFFFLS